MILVLILAMRHQLQGSNNRCSNFRVQNFERFLYEKRSILYNSIVRWTATYRLIALRPYEEEFSC